MGDSVFIDLPLDIDVKRLGYRRSTPGELGIVDRPNAGFYL